MASAPASTYRFLEGGGEAASLIAACDWSKTALGDIEAWPLSLRITLANLLHSSFPTLLFWGPELRCFYNDAFRPSLGEEGKHPAIGKKGAEVWAETWDRTGTSIQEVLAHGAHAWFEDQLIPIYRNGSMENVYWTYSYSPAYGDDGRIEGVLVTCMETTHTVATRKRVEALVSRRTEELAELNNALQKSHDYLQFIINSFKEPLQVLAPVIEEGKVVDFRFRLTNAAYAAYANLTPAKLMDQKVGDIFPGYFQTSSFRNIVKAYESGNPDTWEIHYDQDGLDLYNLMSASRMGDEVIVHFTDFTKLKQMELELLRKIEDLNRSNDNLQDFAHAASHDLKEPIRKIHVFTQMLKSQLREQLKESELQTFERIELATSRMASLIDDLLEFSHVTEVPHEKEDVALDEVVKQVLEDLELSVAETHATLEIDKLPVVSGFKRQIHQSFQNLISNALKYHRPGVAPRISISAATSIELGKPYHIILIKDNGIGFEPQYSDRIFQMFARLHNKQQYTGTGVGLSIVKKIVENHEGLIRVDSTPGQGSTFKLYLPL